MDLSHDTLEARLLELETQFREFHLGPILDCIQDASRTAPTHVAQNKTFHIDGRQITCSYDPRSGDGGGKVWACSEGRVLCEANTPESRSSFLVAGTGTRITPSSSFPWPALLQGLIYEP